MAKKKSDYDVMFEYRILPTMTAEEHMVLVELRKGEVLTGKELIEKCFIRSPQVLRQIIHTLRIKGQPICSSNSGYWIARSNQELMDNSIHLEKFAVTVLAAAKGMRSRVVGQIEMGE